MRVADVIKGRRRILDDRGESSPLYDGLDRMFRSAARSTLGDGEFVRIRSDALGLAGVTERRYRRMTRTVLVGFLVSVLLPGGVLMAAVLRSPQALGSVPGVLLFFLGLFTMLLLWFRPLAGLFPSRSLPVEYPGAVRAALLSASRCASCAYSLADASVEADGCRVCAECGRAWRTAEVGAFARAAEPERVPSVSDPAGLLPGMVDHRGRRVSPVPMSRLSDLSAEERRALASREASTGLLDFLFSPGVAWTLVALAVGLFVMEVFTRPTQWKGMGGFVFVTLCIAWGSRTWAATGRARARVKAFLEQKRCPGCGYPLESLIPERDRCVVCVECGSAWRLPRNVFAELPPTPTDRTPGRKSGGDVS